MSNDSTDTEPSVPKTIENLVTRALAAQLIDEVFAAELRQCSGWDDAVYFFYTYMYEEKGAVDPKEYLRAWRFSV